MKPEITVSVGCHRIVHVFNPQTSDQFTDLKKPENIHIQQADVRIMTSLFLKTDFDYQ